MNQPNMRNLFSFYIHLKKKITSFIYTLLKYTLEIRKIKIDSHLT